MTDLQKGFRLGYLRAQIDNECISTAEIVELQGYHKEIYELDDVVLAEWAGISELHSHPRENKPCEIKNCDNPRHGNFAKCRQHISDGLNSLGL